MALSKTVRVPSDRVSAVYRAHRAAVKAAMRYVQATPGTQTIRRLEDRVHNAELRFDRAMMGLLRA